MFTTVTDQGRAPMVSRRDESDRKLVQVRRLLTERGFGAVGLTWRRNFAWLTAGGSNHVALNTDIGVATIVVTPASAAVVAPVNEAAHIWEEELADLDLERVMVPWDDLTAVSEEISRRAGRGARIAVDSDLEPDLIGLRSRLTEREETVMAEIGSLAAAAVTATFEGTWVGESRARSRGAPRRRAGDAPSRSPGAPGRVGRTNRALRAPAPDIQSGSFFADSGRRGGEIRDQRGPYPVGLAGRPARCRDAAQVRCVHANLQGLPGGDRAGPQLGRDAR